MVGNCVVGGVGDLVGNMVEGLRVGLGTGDRVGKAVVGRRVGALVGDLVGLEVVGALEGIDVVGLAVGEVTVGEAEGAVVVGDRLGKWVCPLRRVGRLVGLLVGNLVGRGVGLVGEEVVNFWVGENEGESVALAVGEGRTGKHALGRVLALQKPQSSVLPA